MSPVNFSNFLRLVNYLLPVAMDLFYARMFQVEPSQAIRGGDASIWRLFLKKNLHTRGAPYAFGQTLTLRAERTASANGPLPWVKQACRAKNHCQWNNSLACENMVDLLVRSFLKH